MNRALWVDRFAHELGRLGARATPELLVDMGLELYPTLLGVGPEVAAQAEFLEWPPHDD